MSTVMSGYFGSIWWARFGLQRGLAAIYLVAFTSALLQFKALLGERGALEGTEVADMVLRALSYLVRHGPQSDQDRWEETAGLNTFTLAACIAALVCGAEYLPADARELALDFADFWNSRLEDWTAVRDTALARRHGIQARCRRHR